uniref:(northern house mosquito) hypothetical protein n=1 Tax=Culex pipiens TaxID=7175 RepID=A0A8D8B2Y7_CULPI
MYDRFFKEGENTEHSSSSSSSSSGMLITWGTADGSVLRRPGWVSVNAGDAAAVMAASYFLLTRGDKWFLKMCAQAILCGGGGKVSRADVVWAVVDDDFSPLVGFN